MRIRNGFINSIKALLVVCMSVLFLACGDIAIYDEHDPKLHGKIIRFNVEMIYVPIDEITGDMHKEKKNYKYSIVVKSYGLNIHTIANTNYKSIKSGMEFTIVKSYLNKVYLPVGDDLRMLVLQDEHGVQSVISITFLKYTNLDRSLYEEYLV